MIKKVKRKIAFVINASVMAISQISVNSTCHGRFYQDELSEQLNSIRKYNDKESNV